MTSQQITAGVVIAAVFILSIFDIVMAYLSGWRSDHIVVYLPMVLKYPSSSSLGFLMGHLFAQMYKTGD